MNSEKNPKFSRAIHKPINAAKRLSRLPHKDLYTKVDEIEQSSLKQGHSIYELKQEDAYLKKLDQQNEAKIEELGHRITQMDQRITDVLHQMTILNEKLAKRPKSNDKDVEQSSSSTGDQLVADEHLLDNFYVQFERWFRGTEEEIAKRQSVYMPYFKKSKLDSQDLPAIDIGCGNGEFVEMLSQNGIRAIGLDLNKAMVENVKKKGLEAVQGDALSYLRKQKSNSCMAITGFHIVEHIPFLDLVKIFNECYRVLAPGGFVIFETPNPENTIVGSCNFYNDPSHLHPLPPAFLELVMKTRGFTKNEIKRLHPIKPKIDHNDPLVKEMAERFFGPQDYAVICYK